MNRFAQSTGIMRGMVIDYDNDVVASKAWCMLFAVGDWVDAETRETLIYSRRNAPQGPPGQARESTL